MRSITTVRVGIEVRLSMRLASRSWFVIRICSCCTSSETSATLAIKVFSSSRSSVNDKVVGGSADAPRAPTSKRRPSEIGPLDTDEFLTSAGNPGATFTSTSNRFSRLPPGASGISRRADIGLIIVISPARVVCTSPIGA